MSPPRGERTHLLHLTFRPTVRLVSVVRRFVTELYSELLLGPEATDNVAMATHELLENSVKYSTDGTSELRIQLEETLDGVVHVVVETSNPCAPQDVARVEELLRRLDGDDPMKHYVELMTETAPRKEGSGLGLARLRAEAGGHVSCRTDGTNLVIIATLSVARPAAS